MLVTGETADQKVIDALETWLQQARYKLYILSHGASEYNIINNNNNNNRNEDFLSALSPATADTQRAYKENAISIRFHNTQYQDAHIHKYSPEALHKGKS